MGNLTGFRSGDWRGVHSQRVIEGVDCKQMVFARPGRRQQSLATSCGATYAAVSESTRGKARHRKRCRERQIGYRLMSIPRVKARNTGAGTQVPCTHGAAFVAGEDMLTSR